jgi:hypothetical protein
MKKKFTPMEIMKAIRKGLSETEGIVKGAFNENCNYYRRPTVKGFFNIKVKTQAEGSVIGFVEITYRPETTMIWDEYDVHSEFICMNDDPERIIRNILNHSDPESVDNYESIIPVCPHCGSTCIDENTPHTDKEGNYITCEFVCCDCQCEFDMPAETMETHCDYYITDELGGVHTDGIGYAPDGIFCGECTHKSCAQCKAWNKEVE